MAQYLETKIEEEICICGEKLIRAECPYCGGECGALVLCNKGQGKKDCENYGTDYCYSECKEREIETCPYCKNKNGFLICSSKKCDMNKAFFHILSSYSNGSKKWRHINFKNPKMEEMMEV